MGIRLGRAYLTLGSNYATAPTRASGLNFALVIPLGPKVNVLSTAATGNGTHSAPTEIQKSLPLGTGYGYRVSSDPLNGGRTDAGFYYQNQYGQWTLEGSTSGDENSWRFGERSGLVWMHSHLLQTRWLQDSLAVIEVPDQPNVDVYVNNQLIGHTNGSGIAVTPWLVPYDRNTIRIDDRSVAMDTVLDSIDKVVVPRWRTGLFVQFKPEASSGAILILQTADGALIPAGAVAKVGADQAEVAFHGEVFFPLFRAPALVHVEWPGHACDAAINDLPEGILPKVGPVVCK
jgi:outer membrane usher protein